MQKITLGFHVLACINANKYRKNYFYISCFPSRNGSLDILIADTPILDYYRATDHGCKLQKIGDAINEDTYAVGMTKGFPLKVSLRNMVTYF